MLSEVLELPVVRRGLPTVLSDAGKLGREITWAHVLEVPDPSRLLRGGELVLTTGMGMGREPRAQRRWVGSLGEQGAAGLLVEIGLTFRQQVPQEVVKACREHDLVLVALSRRVAFVEVTRAIMELTIDRRTSIGWHADELQQRLTELVLTGKGAPEVLDELATLIAAPVAFETARGELVHCATGPVPESEALRALEDLRRYEPSEGVSAGAFSVPLPGPGAGAGRLVVLGIERSPDELQCAALERAATVIALEQLNRRHAEQLHVRTRGTLLSDLAAGRTQSREAAQRARLLGFPSAGRELLPFVLRGRDAGTALSAHAEGAWHEVVAALREVADARGLPTLVGFDAPELLGVVALPPGTTADDAFDRLDDAVQEALARCGADARDAVVAFGAPAAGWEGAGEGLRRASRCAGAARTAPPRRWHDARRSGVRELLYELRDRPELEAFAHEQLGPLLDAPSDRSGTLLETLRAVVRAQGRKSAAARALHLDRTALYARLRRIESQLAVDLDDAETVLGLELAFEVLTMLRGEDGGGRQRPS